MIQPRGGEERPGSARRPSRLQRKPPVPSRAARGPPSARQKRRAADMKMKHVRDTVKTAGKPLGERT